MRIRSVLIVDDDEHIRRISELTGRKVGNWTVLVAASGPEALELARERRPDLILLDVMMPGMDGPSTFERLRAQPESAEIPVIFLTAKVEAQEVERYLELGAIGVIAKPFDPLRLPEEVRRIAGER